MNYSLQLIWFLSTFCLFCLTIPLGTLAQIVPDSTLPNNTIAITGKNSIRIEGGTQTGSNLFHSFREFAIPTGSEAYFNNTLNIQNIFSRVTGSNFSHIDGIIRANGQANLFLINPSGIIFGRHAQLNIGGSFIATTANSIKFDNGSEFNASNPQNIASLLTIKVPIGLQFSGANPGIINVEGSGHNFGFSRKTGALETNEPTNNLAVQPGKTLALIGGNIALTGGNLKAESGSIALFSIVRGEAPIEMNNNQITFKNQPNTQFGNIILSGTASINTSGLPGGYFQIQSRNLTLEQGSVMVSINQGSQPGKNVFINALENIELIGRKTGNETNSGIGTGFFVRTNGSGEAGNLTITSDRLTLRDGAAIAMGTDGSGNSGHLQIIANKVFLGGLSADGATLTAIVSNPTIPSTGIGGDINIQTQQLTLENGAVISVSTFGAGTSGNIKVIADEILFRGTSTTGGIGSGFYARTTLNTDLISVPQLTGNAGNVTIIANRLRLQDRGRINVGNLGKGNAGNINITASTIELDNQSLITATQRQAEQGNITIQSENLRLRHNSNITTDASSTVTLDTGEKINLGGNSTNGGNIFITTNTLVALENSDITANAQQSFGGRVIINSRGIFGTTFRQQTTPQSDITATSSLGAQFSGIVQINTPDTSVSESVVHLPGNFVAMDDRIVSSCRTSQNNSFSITGSGGLPESPNETLLGRTVWRDLRPPNEISRHNTTLPSPRETSKLTPIIEVTGWIKNLQGEVELIAGVQGGRGAGVQRCRGHQNSKLSPVPSPQSLIPNPLF
ncbi:filamentous hemagglutinin N-terminal domain-containing protein [Aerosakkonemataceae cyanobacterium BLCC-F154]|uniref:Filamentous hemagglutinin N-terminal domain-containing protein n=1 Tax=Floridaenema fluviatile BLCC-F154 TaxID=3153640 RepID=A0ABV4YFS4_9CYAN